MLLIKSLVSKLISCEKSLFHATKFRYTAQATLRNYSCDGNCKRKFFVCGNWRMYGCKDRIFQSTQAFLKNINTKCVDVTVAVPFPYLEYAKKTFPRNIETCAQNCYKKTKGAYTGEVSPEMIKDVGTRYVLLGHPERRILHKESDDFLTDKAVKALEHDLRVIYCVGENRFERDTNRTEQAILKQLEALANKMTSWNRVILTYQPVWAIGTGKPARPYEAEHGCMTIRSYLCEKFGIEVGSCMRILYGGSVTKANSIEFAKEQNIDGFLVGRASLKNDFLHICHAKERGKKKKPKKRYIC